jgi:hypothetical protein
MSRKSGLDCSGDFKAAPDIRQNGPAASSGYVLRAGPKVKENWNRRLAARVAASSKRDGCQGDNGAGAGE